MNGKNVFLTFALLLSVGFGKYCQWVYQPVVGYPVGTGRCNYIVGSGKTTKEYSFKYVCSSSNVVQEYQYFGTYDCSGTATILDISSDDGVYYECDQSYDSCGKAFGFKSPCSCTAADGNCDYAISISLVDQICVYLSSESYSYMWDIQCGSISSAYAQKMEYSNQECSGNPYQTVVFDAGCNKNDTDTIICPANKATFSIISLAIVLLICVLSSWGVCKMRK